MINHFKILFMLLLIVRTLSFFCTPISVDEAQKTLRIGYYEFPKFQDINENGEYSG